MPAKQGRYWFATWPLAEATRYDMSPLELFNNNDEIVWVYGQQEIGEGGLEHYQFVFSVEKKMTLTAVKRLFGGSKPHLELTRSDKADEYVRKEDSRVEGSEFEHGARLMKLNAKVDWDKQLELAKLGKIDEIESGIQMRCWGNIMKIGAHYQKPPLRPAVHVEVHYGVTMSGKSHAVFTKLANEKFYVKDPRTKWWDGYNGEKHVIMDEFCGTIDITHMLRWLDKWPCNVEVKGGQVPLLADKFYLMSNLSPDRWYNEADPEQIAALKRRLSFVKNYLWAYVAPRRRPDVIIVPETEDEEEIEEAFWRDIGVLE